MQSTPGMMFTQAASLFSTRLLAILWPTSCWRQSKPLHIYVRKHTCPSGCASPMRRLGWLELAAVMSKVKLSPQTLSGTVTKAMLTPVSLVAAAAALIAAVRSRGCAACRRAAECALWITRALVVMIVVRDAPMQGQALPAQAPLFLPESAVKLRRLPTPGSSAVRSTADIRTQQRSVASSPAKERATSTTRRTTNSWAARMRRRRSAAQCVAAAAAVIFLVL